MPRVETVVGGVALSASLSAGTGLVQMEQLGGYQTFSSSSFNTGHVLPATYLRPALDVSTTGWDTSPVGGLTLFSQLTESISDGPFSEITSSVVSTVSPSTSVREFEMALGGTIPIDRNKNVSVAITVAKTGSFDLNTGSLGDSTASVTFILNESGTHRATRTFSDIGSDYTEYSFSLTEAERFSIGNWNDISVSASFELSVSTASSAVHGRCSQIEIQSEGGVKIFESPPVDERIFQLTWEN